MKLLVDVGNTRIKWAQSRDRGLENPHAAAHAERSLANVLQAEWRSMPRPENVLVANVAGDMAAESLRHYCEAHFGYGPEFLVPVRAAAGVTNGYREPLQLGADRWAAAIGAYANYGGPVCVIGCGTAITVDTVTRDGRHLGGLIAPGLGVMHNALAAAAPALPEESGEEIRLYAEDTRTAVTSGILYAAAGFAKRVLHEIRADQGESLQVLLTGGDAERLLPRLPGPVTVVPHLVLEGLAVLAGRSA